MRSPLVPGPLRPWSHDRSWPCAGTSFGSLQRSLSVGPVPLLDFHVSYPHTSACVPGCSAEPHAAMPSRPPQNGGPDPQRGDSARSAQRGRGVLMGRPEPRSRSRGTGPYAALDSTCPARPSPASGALLCPPHPFRGAPFPSSQVTGPLPHLCGIHPRWGQLPPHLQADRGRWAPGKPDLPHRWVALVLCGRGQGTLSSGLSHAGHTCGARAPTGRTTLFALPCGFRGPQLTGLSVFVFAGKGLCGSQAFI